MSHSTEQLLGALDVAGDGAVPDGAGHDQVDLRAEQFLQRLDEVDVAPAGAEVLAQSGAEEIEPRDAVLGAQGAVMVSRSSCSTSTMTNDRLRPSCYPGTRPTATVENDPRSPLSSDRRTARDLHGPRPEVTTQTVDCVRLTRLSDARRYVVAFMCYRDAG